VCSRLVYRPFHTARLGGFQGRVEPVTDIEIQNLTAQIRRAQAETDKYVDDGRKLRAEADKFAMESHKLLAEAGKYQRERTTLVITATAAVMGAGAVVGGLIVRLLGAQ
jgi:hypothetical protein